MSDVVVMADEKTAPPPLATQQQWADAWNLFNQGVRELNRLAIHDGITVKLSMRTLGWVPRKKKAKKS